MARGGAVPGAGRKKGVPNKKNQELLEKVASEGITPLQYMLNIMRDTTAEPLVRSDMAKAAAPYIHPKLSSVDAKVSVSSQEAALAELE